MSKYSIMVKCSLLLICLIQFNSLSAQGQQVDTIWTDLHVSLRQAINGIFNQKTNYPYLRFVTNANDVFIRLTYKGLLRSKQTESILYRVDVDGKWQPIKGTQVAADTVLLSFHNLITDNKQPPLDNEYRLFLPVGQTPFSVAIGVIGERAAEVMPAQPEKQLVVYKRLDADQDSIPANTWPAQLERVFDRPLVVFDGTADQTAFLQNSANPVTKAVFIELCAYQQKRGAVQLIMADIKAIHRKGIPAVFVVPCKDHKAYDQEAALRQLKTAIRSIPGVFILPSPANWPAFENAVRKALNEPAGQIVTTRPIVQSRDRQYNWRQRHADELALIKSHAPKNVIFANSIIHYWGGLPKCSIARGQDSWDIYFKPRSLQNMGFGWDRIENVLWRIYHDELDGFKADHVLLMIGTNNLQVNTDEEIIAGLRQLITAVKERQPGSRVLISGVFPRRNMEERVAQLDSLIEKLAKENQISYINPGNVLLNQSGKIREELFGDGLHPNQNGYALLAPQIAEAFKEP